MTVTVQIGTSFESLLMDAPIGLVGSMGWKVIDPVSLAEVIGHKTEGITEPSPGTYFTTATAPLTADQYLIVWDYEGTTASEALVTQVSPIISARYAQVTDLRNYSTLVTSYSDDDLNAALRDAERWIDWYLPPWCVNTDTQLKLSPPDMNPEQAVQLNNATCAQAEYILHMGPGFFISGSTEIIGGDFSEKSAPKLAPKAKNHLIEGYIIKLTGRVSPDWRRRSGILGPYTNVPTPLGGFGWWP